MLKNYLLSMYASSTNDCNSKFLKLLEIDTDAFLLDCGCRDGASTLKFARRIRTRNIYGVDIDQETLKVAEKKGITAVCSNLNKKFPFKIGSFDVVTASQVVEHLYEVDNFVKEIHRVLKIGGYALISTENLSSWDNVFALILGYQEFSNNFSREYRIGNPLTPGHLNKIKEPLLLHVKIPAYHSLKDIFWIHNFKVEKIIGAGYHPFLGKMSSALSSVDSRHARFLIIKARKLRH